MSATKALWAVASSALRGRGAVAAADALCPAVRAAMATPVGAADRGVRAAALLLRSPPVPLGGLVSRLPIARWAEAAANGSAKRAMSSLAADAPASVFAVAEVGGKQYKVTVNDSIVTENMVGRRVGKRRLLVLPHALFLAGAVAPARAWTAAVAHRPMSSLQARRWCSTR